MAEQVECGHLDPCAKFKTPVSALFGNVKRFVETRLRGSRLTPHPVSQAQFAQQFASARVVGQQIHGTLEQIDRRRSVGTLPRSYPGAA